MAARVTSSVVMAAISFSTANFSRVTNSVVMAAVRLYRKQSIARIDPAVDLPCVASCYGVCCFENRSD